MTRKIIFVGGHHGAGKSSLCSAFSRQPGYLVLRQRHLIMDLGRARGLQTWEEIGPRHDELIEDVPAMMLERMNRACAETLLVDCHYAIACTKALRPAACLSSEPYIFDLDPRVVAALGRTCLCGFILMSAPLDLTVRRLADRDGDHPDGDISVDALREQTATEGVFMERLLAICCRFPVLRLENVGTIGSAADQVTIFSQGL